MIVAALESNLHRITSQIRGTLSAGAYANPELNRNLFRKCVETIGFVPLVGNEIVRSSRKLEILKMTIFARSALSSLLPKLNCGSLITTYNRI